MHTPGHSPGCCCLIDHEGSTLYSGDTLFCGGPGGHGSQLQRRADHSPLDSRSTAVAARLDHRAHGPWRLDHGGGRARGRARSDDRAEHPRVVTERLEPPDLDALSDDVATLMELAVDPDGTPLGTIAALCHTPSLVAPFLGWSAALALDGELSKRHHEILALRVAARCESDFEFVEHARYGPRRGHDRRRDRATAYRRRGRGRGLELLGGAAHRGRRPAHRWIRPRRRHVHRTPRPSSPRPNSWRSPTSVGQYTMLSIVANALGVRSRS